MEASSVTGPAKNLLEFCRRARLAGEDSAGLPTIETSIVTYQRRRKTPAHAPDASSKTVEVRAAETNGGAPNRFVAAAQDANIQILVIDERFRFDTRVVGQLRRIVSQYEPDIIQTHNIKSHMVVKLSGLWKRYPWVAYHHGYTTTDLKMLAYNQLDRWSLPSADKVITVCQSFAGDLARAGVPRARISVRHNSVNLDRTAKPEEVRVLKERLGIEEGERVVLAVGRFSREKAHADLINAMHLLQDTHPDINYKLVLVGDGPERERLQSLIESFGLIDRIIFAGHVSDALPYYALADLLALPSHSEGSPNVILEAMAAGVPIVATNVGGVPEIVTHDETGWLVSARDPAAMAEAIGTLLRDAGFSQRLSANGLALVSNRFSPEVYRRSLIEFYHELIAARAGE